MNLYQFETLFGFIPSHNGLFYHALKISNVVSLIYPNVLYTPPPTYQLTYISNYSSTIVGQ